MIRRKIKDIKMHPMVRWYDLGQIVGTGLKVAISSILGSRNDVRIVQAISASGIYYHDYSIINPTGSNVSTSDEPEKKEEIWIDYVSDTGDGWNSTYGIAYYKSQPTLRLNDFETQRGELLIFGGDEVYPAPSRKNYNEKLIIPYETAFGNENEELKPHVYAVPGNHDWYDGLVAFSRLFFSDLKREYKAWVTNQRRSYFALKLPHNWWLLGSDGQLESELDTPQMEFFRAIAETKMKSGDKVILCTAEPGWIYAEKYRTIDESIDQSDLIYLQDEIFKKNGIEIKVFLSGDLHHYRRHEESSKEFGVQKIIAGGGGAFLHPTHGFDVSKIHERNSDDESTWREFTLKKSYPSVKDSKKLNRLNFFFLFRNPGFGIITGLLYFMTAWMISASVNFRKPQNIFFDSFHLTFKAFMDNPFAALWILTVFALFILMNDTHSRIYKWIGGIAHCTIHFILIFWTAIISSFVAEYLNPGEEFTYFLVSALFVFSGGWIFGSVIMGFYLFISLNIFGRHDNEAFSALRIQDYKNFLRLHINKSGKLTIFPIKLERVPRKWKLNDNSNPDVKSIIVPLDGSQPELIEEPVTLN